MSVVITPELVQALLSPDAKQRQNAEQYLSTQLTLEQRVQGYLQYLEQHSNSNNPAGIQLVIVLLRRDMIQIDDTNRICQLIPNLIKFQLKDCLAQACSSLELLDGNMQTAVTVIQQILLRQHSQQSPMPALWTAIAELAPNAYSASKCWKQNGALPNLQNIETLECWIVTAMADSESIPMLAPQVSNLLPSLPKNDDKLWELLIVASESVPDLLLFTSSPGNGLPTSLQVCITAAANNVDNNNNLQAIQVVSNLLNSPQETQGKEWRREQAGAVLTPCLAACWNALQGTEDDLEEPVPLQEDAYDDDDYPAILMAELLRVPGALPILMPVLEQALSTADQPQVHRAAMIAMQCCVEAAPVSFAPYQAIAAQTALRFIDPPSVQFRAVHLLGLLCETSDKKNGLRKTMAAPILEFLARSTHSPISKIAAMACQAIVSFCRPDSETDDDDNDQSEFMAPYVESLVQALGTGPLQSDNVVVQIRSVGSLACLAQSVGTAFARFYSMVMPELLQRAQWTGNYEVQTLAGASLESATIVGQAVGRDTFGADALRILDGINSPELQALTSCARIASVLGEQYAPYVEKVLPHLLQRATDSADIEFSEGELSGLKESKRMLAGFSDGIDSMTMAIPGRGLTKVTINTTKIQEKAQAARAVYEHAAALGENFGPYSVPCLDAFLPLVEFRFSSELRGTAAQTLAVVFESACSFGGSSAGMEVPKRYLPRIFKTLAKQLEEEDTSDMETLYALADSLSDLCRTVRICCNEYGPELLGDLSQDDVRAMVQSCMKSIVACLQRRSKITNVLAQDTNIGVDERYELESTLQSEQDLLTPLVDSIGYMLKTYRETFIPIFECEVAPTLAPYLGGGHDARAILSSVCLFDDCIEHCGPVAAAKFATNLLEGVLTGIAASDADLKCAAIYGLSQLARYAPGSVLAPHAAKLVQELSRIASDHKGKDGSEAIYENAVAALASLVLFPNAPFKNQGLKQEFAINMFLESLPLREDEDEAEICHAGLCDLVEQSAFDIGSECERLIAIFQKILVLVEEGEEIASPQTREKISNLLIQLQNHAGSGINPRSFGFANVVSP